MANYRVEISLRKKKPSASFYLSSFPLFQGVDDSLLNRLALATQIRFFDKRHLVIQKGAPNDNLIFVISGRLQAIDMTEHGKEIGLGFIEVGDFFGELSVVDGKVSSASVLTLQRSELLYLPRKDALHLFYEVPLVAERLINRFAQRLRQAADYRSILGISGAYQRVYALLIRLMKKTPAGMWVIESIPTQQEIAITVNTSRETVSRASQELIKEGVIEKDMKRIIIRQPERLLVLAREEYLS